MKKINVAIILSAGQGSRFKKNHYNSLKQLVKIAGKTLLEHILERFEKHKKIDEIILVVSEQSRKAQEEIVKKNHFKKVKKIILGGITRQESSKNGVFACDFKKIGKILIHDATRPFLSEGIINKIIRGLDSYKTVTVGIPLVDTLLKINQKNLIVEIPQRNHFRREQTPQGFEPQIIKKAHELAIKENFKEATDDCGLVKKYGLSKILVIPGEEENLKITYPLDLYLAKKLLQIKNGKKLK
jgi:ribitol-5-phosphate 2-dehydrogenase (NADP+) / D-ribitol-5-phosphate cytidylyltransferase